MNGTPSDRNRVERRDRALRLRRKINALAAATGVTAVGAAGYLIAVNAATTKATVLDGRSVTDGAGHTHRDNGHVGGR